MHCDRIRAQSTDAYAVQLKIVQCIQSLFNADEVFLILLDSTDPGIGIKKTPGHGLTWKDQATFRAKDSLVCRAIARGCPVDAHDLCSGFEHETCYDQALELPIEKLYMAPLLSVKIDRRDRFD